MKQTKQTRAAFEEKQTEKETVVAPLSRPFRLTRITSIYLHAFLTIAIVMNLNALSLGLMLVEIYP